jgi:uncharacterized RDD family membrane protein YckC
LLFGILFSISVAQYLLGADTIKLPKTGPVSSSAGFFVVEFVYLAAAWTLTGRTVGKQVFGLRAIQADGARLSRRRAVARAAWCAVFGIPSLLWAGVSSRNAAVHDIVLHTAVVYDWSQHAEPVVPLPSAVVGVAAPDPEALTEAS